MHPLPTPLQDKSGGGGGVLKDRDTEEEAGVEGEEGMPECVNKLEGWQCKNDSSRAAARDEDARTVW